MSEALNFTRGGFGRRFTVSLRLCDRRFLGLDLANVLWSKCKPQGRHIGLLRLAFNFDRAGRFVGAKVADVKQIPQRPEPTANSD